MTGVQTGALPIMFRRCNPTDCARRVEPINKTRRRIWRAARKARRIAQRFRATTPPRAWWFAGRPRAGAILCRASFCPRFPAHRRHLRRLALDDTREPSGPQVQRVGLFLRVIVLRIDRERDARLCDAPVIDHMPEHDWGDAEL